VIQTRVRQAAELLHIAELLHRYPNSLSGGQRQRVAVARSIAYDADVLLMDEPLSNLDALLRMEMRAELKSLVRELRSTVIYVTHDQVEAMSMGDRIAVMKDGAIQQVGPPIAVYDNPANTFVAGFIGNPPMNLVEVETSGSEVRVGGQVLSLEGTPGDGRHILGIRAENLELAGEGIGLSTEVIVAEPLGSHNLLTCALGEGNFKVATRPHEKPGPGTRVWLHPVPDKVRWFDPETGWAR
jgi:multiple sugar transport system ATP-binding protein